MASDTKGGGGKGVRAEKKTQTNFKNVFFLLQKLNKTIIGPPKHVIHLVWSASVIPTAIKTALKVAQNGHCNSKSLAKVDR